MLVAVTFQRRHVDCPLPLGKKITFLIWIGGFIIKKPINCKSSYRFVYEGLIQRVPGCVSHDYSKLIAIPSRVWRKIGAFHSKKVTLSFIRISLFPRTILLSRTLLNLILQNALNYATLSFLGQNI